MEKFPTKLWFEMRSIQKKLRIFLVNRKTFTLLICTLLSVFLWTIIRVSKNLQREISVNISIINIPEDMFLRPSQKHQIKILAEGKGFTLLKYYSEEQTLTVDFNDLEYIGDKKYKLSKNISNKLNTSTLSKLKIQNTYSDTIYIDLTKKYTKKVPVIVHLNADFQQEYQLTELIVKPDSVVAWGAKPAIDSLNAISISFSEKKYVKKSFKEIYKLKNTDFINFNTEKITVNAIVDKMSEQLIKVPIRILNIPTDCQIKIFPSEVTILCSGDLNILKNIAPEDIVVEADYEDTERGTFLPLTIRTKLKRVKLSFLEDDKVDFLIRKI
ncbi:MAG: YbbR-like domain-containing protein [Capnocytophaga sp.]|nr:YbbR-like domain-containing protein [Capnocytophaga sp.]